MMRVKHQLPIHIKQGYAAEDTMGHANGVGHPRTRQKLLSKH